MSLFEKEDSPATNARTIIKEEQTSSDESPIKQKVKVRRHRASVACTSCRDRRIRCVVPSGKKACIQCERSSTSCVIKDDDERRRPISRAYVYSLVERVALLERMLEDQGLPVPPFHYPPETRCRSRRQQEPTLSDHTSTSPSSFVSDDHTSSSPSSSDYHSRSEAQSPGLRKRLPISRDTSFEDSRAKKRMRNDSLVKQTDFETEPLHHSPGNISLHYSGLQNLDRLATLPLPNSASLWPVLHDHASISNPIYSELQNMNNDLTTFGAWHVSKFGFQDYTNPSLALHDIEGASIEQQNGSIDAPTHTNLDFMPLNVNS